MTPIYDGFHGYIYSSLLEHTTADIELIEKWLGPSTVHVLDLCCGSGRFARRLAADGRTVTGVDMSEDMITRARGQWDPADVAALPGATFVCADALTLDLGKIFNAVLIGGLSISVLDDRESRIALLRAARRHLAPGGTLIFDYMPFPEMGSDDESYHTFPFPGEGGQAFMVLGVLQSPSNGVQVTNMYSELIDSGNRTQRFLSAETVSYLSDEDLREELDQANFRTVEKVDMTPVSPSGKKLPRTLMLRCEAW